MISLVKLEIQGFRSFKEKATFVFPQKGAVLISGRYKDAQLSSGAGKSTCPIAIAYALGYSDLPATELKNWSVKNLSVTLTITDGSQSYTIIRDPKLKLIVGEQTLDGQVAEDRLKQILGATPEICRTLTYRPQREHGQFLNKTDAEQKEFLSALLNLEELERAADQIAAEQTSLTSKILQQTAELTTLNSSLVNFEVDARAFDGAKTEYEQASLRLNEVKSGTSLNEAKQALLMVETELNKVRAVTATVEKAKNENQYLRRSLMSLKAEVEKLSTCLCPTCQREWSNSGDLAAQKREDMKRQAQAMESNNALIRNAEPILQSEGSLRERQATLQQTIGQATTPIHDAERRFFAAKQLLESLSQKKATCESYKARIASLSQSIRSIEADNATLVHASTLLGRNGFLSVIFDEVLSEIERRSNELIGQIPNVGRYAIKISSNSVTKSGTVKKAIKTVLFKDGREVSLKTLSGGQACAVELCVDLAVNETIRSRSGTKLGWIVLDEAMDGLDTESKQSALELIKSKINGLIIVIDHATEVKEGFETSFEVEFDGRNSYLV